MSICLQCNTNFKAKSDGINKFCSKSCNAKYHNSRRPKAVYAAKCEGCDEIITNKSNKFCSHSCSARFYNNQRTPAEPKPKKKYPKEPPKVCAIRFRTCTSCGKIDMGRTGRFQSPHCSICNPSKAYRVACDFTFDLRKYPDRFDLLLLEKHGMFHPTNNPKGVSRDHMYSVNEGKRNKIDPKIISHPANCQIILQSDNMKKFDRSCITIEELLVRISEWESQTFSEEPCAVTELTQAPLAVTPARDTLHFLAVLH